MFAQIENNEIINIIVAEQNFIDTLPGQYVNVSAVEPKPGIGWIYDGAEFTIPTPPAPPVDPRTMKIVVTSISSNDPNQLLQDLELTCSIGSLISVNVEIHAIGDNSLLPVSEMFRLPISGPGGVVIYTLVNFSVGLATISTVLMNSGKWTITEEDVNSAISSPEQQFLMEDSVVIYVLQ